MFLKRQNQGCNSTFQLKKRRKIRRKFLVVFGKTFPEFPENFLPKFPEIFLLLLFLKNKIRAVTCVSSSENAGKSGGKFPGIFPEKVFHDLLKFPRISEFPEFPEISQGNLTETITLYNMKIPILELQYRVIQNVLKIRGSFSCRKFPDVCLLCVVKLSGHYEIYFRDTGFVCTTQPSMRKICAVTCGYACRTRNVGELYPAGTSDIVSIIFQHVKQN